MNFNVFSLFLLATYRTIWLRLPVYSLIICCVIAASFTVNALATFFGDKLSNADSIANQHKVVRGGRLAGELFVELVNGSHITFNRETGRLDIGINCEAFKAGFDDDRDNPLKSRFCSIDIGAIVRGQIKEWNARASLVAVRDNRRNARNCENSLVQPIHYVPKFCYPNKWTGNLLGSINDPRFKVHALAKVNQQQEPAPEVYGFLARDIVEGFGDWRRFPNPENTVVLKSEFRIKKRGGRAITIDYVGELISVKATQFGSAGKLFPPKDRRIICARFRSSKKCIEELKEQRGNDLPRSGRITFDFPQNWNGEVELVLKPSIAVHARVRQLKKAFFVTPRDGELLLANPNRTVNISGNIQAKCREVSSLAAIVGLNGESDLIIPNVDSENTKIDKCMLAWKPSGISSGIPKLAEAELKREINITTATDRNPSVPLTEFGDDSEKQEVDPGNRISANALDLGMVSIMGFDDKDPAGLMGIIKSNTIPGTRSDVALTIDADMQRIAHNTLQDVIRGKARYRDVTSRLLSNKGSRRKASLLLLDAGPLNSPNKIDPLTGRILAVSSWPSARQNISQWDLKAQASFRPTEDLLAARGWSQNNKFYAPGSTFKVVTTLAAINRAANGDKKIAAYLGGSGGRDGLSRNELRSLIGGEFGFGFNASRLEVPRYSNGRIVETMTIRNRGARLCDHIASTRCTDGSRLAMRDMLTKSDNLYFARLSLLLDIDNVSSGSGNQRIELVSDIGKIDEERHFFYEMIDHIWPQQGTNLLPGYDSVRFSRLYATPIQLDSKLSEHPRLYRLALNGIGQSAQATPLAMASIAASISNGMVVRPWLGGDPTALALSKPVVFSDKTVRGGAAIDVRLGQTLLEELRIAMKQVVLRGTARTAFQSPNDGSLRDQLRKNIYGKTGTAQIGNPQLEGNTAWFIGWVNGGIVPGYENRRIAFACMISHAKIKNAGGGRVCGPVIRELFLDIANTTVSGEDT